MKALNSAAELLNAVDAGANPDCGTTMVRGRGRSEFDVGGFKFRCFNAVSELYACDWIYAASFAAHSNSVYLAGYSGRVVVVNQAGEAVRVYDIDDVPRRIIDTGEYLYLLTRRRLYVLRDDYVHALIEVPNCGDLLVARRARADRAVNAPSTVSIEPVIQSKPVAQLEKTSHYRWTCYYFTVTSILCTPFHS